VKKDLIPLSLFGLVPFAFISPGIVHVGHQFFLVLTTLVIMGILIKNRWLRVMFAYIALWQLIIFVSGFLALDMFSRRINPQVGQGFSQVSFAISAAIIFKWASESKIKLTTVYNFICVTVLIQMLIAIFQLNGIDPVFNLLAKLFKVARKLDPSFATGTLGNNNFFAAYIAITLPFFFRGKWRWFIFPIAAFLLTTTTSSAVFAVLTGIAYYYRDISLPQYKIGKKWRYLIGAILLILLCFIYTTVADVPFWKSPRFGMWSKGLNKVYSGGIGRIVFGLGPGASWGSRGTLHNEWLSLFFHYGLMGMVLLTGFVVNMYKGNKILFTAFVIASVNALGNLSMHLAPSAFLIIMIAGLCEREKYNG